MFRWIPALCAVAFAASPADAKNQQRSTEPVVTIIVPNSAGTPSCGAWIAARANPSNGRAIQYEKWVWGFESGLNWAGRNTRGDVLRGMEGEGVLGWVDQFCREHPLDDLVSAVVNLDRELARRRAAH